MNKIAKHLTKAALAALLIGGSISAQVVSIVNNSGTGHNVIFRIKWLDGSTRYRNAGGILGQKIIEPGARRCFRANDSFIDGLFVCPAGQCLDWRGEAPSYAYEPVGQACGDSQETSAVEFEINAQEQIKFTNTCHDCSLNVADII